MARIPLPRTERVKILAAKAPTDRARPDDPQPRSARRRLRRGRASAYGAAARRKKAGRAAEFLRGARHRRRGRPCLSGRLTLRRFPKTIPACARSSDLSWIRQPSEKLLGGQAGAAIGMAVIRLERAGRRAADPRPAGSCFPGFGEADLVDRCARRRIVLSLVAEDEGVVDRLHRLLAADGRGRRSAVPRRRAGAARRLSGVSAAGRSRRGSCARAMPVSRRSARRCRWWSASRNYYGRFGYSNRRVANFESDYQSPYLMALSFGAAPWEGRLVYPPAFAALTEDAPLQAHDRV